MSGGETFLAELRESWAHWDQPWYPTVWSYYRGLGVRSFIPAIFGISVSVWFAITNDGWFRWVMVFMAALNVAACGLYAHTYLGVVRPHQEWWLRWHVVEANQIPKGERWNAT